MDLVRQLRREKGWSQEQLAAASGVSRATVQRVEGGKVVPDKETSLALAGAFGVDVARLRQQTGLAAHVFRVSEINNSRAPTAEELRILPPSMRRVFEEYSVARLECESVTLAMKEFTDRSSAAGRVRMEAFSRCSDLALKVLESPGDLELRKEYRGALETLKNLPMDRSAEEAIALGNRTQTGLRDLSEKGLALTRLLIQFV